MATPLRGDPSASTLPAGHTWNKLSPSEPAVQDSWPYGTGGMHSRSDSLPALNWAGVSKKIVSAGTSSMLARLPPVTRCPALSTVNGDAAPGVDTKLMTWSL